MTEKPKRLSPTKDTLRQLYVLSGNQCAFLGCIAALFNKDGDFVGQICHIEGVGRKGERHNRDMSNEQRRAPENLLILCYPHHVRIDDVESYSVKEMKRIKAEHERKFGDLESMAQRMAESIQDVTLSYQPRRPQNLGRLLATFGTDFCEGEINEMVYEFNEALDEFSRLTPAAKRVFSIALDWSREPRNIQEAPLDSTYFIPYEIHEAIGKIPYEVKQLIDEIERANLITDHDTDQGTIFLFLQGQLDWEIWTDFRNFCHANSISITQTLESGDFSCLDD